MSMTATFRDRQEEHTAPGTGPFAAIWLVSFPTMRLDGSLGTHTFVVFADSPKIAVQFGRTLCGSEAAHSHRRGAAVDCTKGTASSFPHF